MREYIKGNVHTKTTLLNHIWIIYISIQPCCIGISHVTHDNQSLAFNVQRVFSSMAWFHREGLD